MRLIDAEPLYDKLEDYYKSSCGKAHEMARNCLDAVCDMPTVDAAPVVHGVWKDDRTDIMCTACNERFSDEIVFASLRHCDGEMWMKYCPYCGAKMDLEDEQ